ncbi:MAG TPA: serine hydrolase, partial [Planctomycetota bacterium]|nr:serine hydrolase [Planctomycetota bacterium]
MRRIAAGFAVLLGLSAGVISAPIARADESAKTRLGPVDGYETVARALDAAIEREMDAKRIPGFAIVLVDEGEVVYARAFGREDPGADRPLTLRSLARFGSVSKLLTAIAVAQLVEKGELDLDKPVTTWLPSFRPENPFGKEITLRLLHSHRSGLVREPPVGSYFDVHSPSIEDTVASLSATRLVYEPDTRTKYSNAAIAVAGRVVEVVTKRSFAEHVAESVFAPLGMTTATFAPKYPAEPGTARGLMWSYDGRVTPAPEFDLGTSPAGSLTGSILDLGAFLKFLTRAKEERGAPILSRRTLEELWSPRPEGGDRGYGIGFHVQPFAGMRRVGHGGAVYGFATSLAAVPDARIGVAAVATLDCANSLAERITDHALRLLLARRESTETKSFEHTRPLDPGFARTISGVYFDEAGGSVELEAREDRLFIRRGVLTAEVRQRDGTLWVDDAHTWGPEIRSTGPGEISIDISERRYRRADEKPPSPPSTELRELIGEYGPEDGRVPPGDHNVLYILERNGKLCALIEWFFEYPLRRAEKDRWLFPDHGGLYHGEAIHFERDSNGRVTRAIVAGVPFIRRRIGPAEGDVFRIDPLEPIDVLRDKALKSKPPEEKGDFRDQELVELVRVDPTLRLDVRYATTRNFLGSVLYEEPRAFLQKPAAEALRRAHERVKRHGFGLTIHDGYRPWFVTKMFWDATPPALRNFVADPSKGSRHNRGCAIDLSLCDLETGE